MTSAYIIIVAVLAITGVAVMVPREGLQKRDILFIVVVALVVIAAVAAIVLGADQ